MACAGEKTRASHPSEMFGDAWWTEVEDEPESEIVLRSSVPNGPFPPPKTWVTVGDAHGERE
jgi:hypothetical protein